MSKPELNEADVEICQEHAMHYAILYLDSRRRIRIYNDGNYSSIPQHGATKPKHSRN